LLPRSNGLGVRPHPVQFAVVRVAEDNNAQDNDPVPKRPPWIVLEPYRDRDFGQCQQQADDKAEGQADIGAEPSWRASGAFPRPA
jgi:hypothetical protein